MKQIIFVLGTTGTGKTTIGQTLAKNLNCGLIEADKFYDYLGKTYSIPDFDKLCNPDNWSRVPTIEQDRVTWYKNKIKELGKVKTCIIEGATPVYKKEFEGIQEALGFDLKEIVVLYLKPSNWGQLHKQKHGILPDLRLQEAYDREVSLNFPNAIKITDINYLTSPLVYQRKGFTDIKWEKLGMKDKDLTGKSILDLGCNEGWFSDYSFKQGAKEYTGVDNQIKEIIYARNYHQGQFIHSDINQYLDTTKEKFDICVMSSTLHYFNNKAEVIEKISKIADELVLEIPVSLHDDNREHPKAGKDYTIPTTLLVVDWLLKGYQQACIIGESIPPDDSYRLVFNATKPL
jgi:SAM-dependent methyltransferase